MQPFSRGASEADEHTDAQGQAGAGEVEGMLVSYIFLYTSVANLAGSERGGMWKEGMICFAGLGCF